MPDTLFATPATQAPRPSSPYTLTIALIAINTLVFLAMVATGISFTAPTALDVANWGGDFGPLTLGEHQYWRLFTSCFLHFGIIRAVFGFLLIKRRSLNPLVVQRIGKSAGIFVLYNVFYGTISRTTDLSAHFGGLLTGFLVGMLLLRPGQQSPKSELSPQ
jgi:rhomboid protease GluP